jgi:hypothetical protein
VRGRASELEQLHRQSASGFESEASASSLALGSVESAAASSERASEEDAFSSRGRRLLIELRKACGTLWTMASLLRIEKPTQVRSQDYCDAAAHAIRTFAL